MSLRNLASLSFFYPELILTGTIILLIVLDLVVRAKRSLALIALAGIIRVETDRIRSSRKIMIDPKRRRRWSLIAGPKPGFSCFGRGSLPKRASSGVEVVAVDVRIGSLGISSW